MMKLDEVPEIRRSSASPTTERMDSDVASPAPIPKINMSAVMPLDVPDRVSPLKKSNIELTIGIPGIRRRTEARTGI